MTKKNKRKKRHYAQMLLPWIIVAVMSYTIAAFLLQFVTNTEISSTLTISYFTFWGTEIIAIATIKTVKEGKKKTNEDINEEDVEN